MLLPAGTLDRNSLCAQQVADWILLEVKRKEACAKKWSALRLLCCADVQLGCGVEVWTAFRGLIKTK